MNRRPSSVAVNPLWVLLLAGVLMTATNCWPERALWTTRTPMPTPRTSAGTAVVDGRIYVIGGLVERDGAYRALATVELYDPLTDTWAAKADLPTPRGDLAIAVLDGKVYAIGGDTQGEVFSNVEVYDPATDTWSARAAMAQPRRSLAAAVVGSRVYAIGGLDSWFTGYDGLRLVEEYDPLTDTWAAKADLPTGRCCMPAVATGNTILTIGGWRPQIGGWLTSDVYEYDPLGDSWTRRRSIPVLAIDHHATLMGGYVYAFPVDKTVYVYDLAADSWTLGPQMPLVLSGAAYAAVDGRFYCLGGGDVSTEKGTVYVLEPALPDLLGARTQQLAALAGSATDLPVEVTLASDAEGGTYPSLVVDLSAVGADPALELVHQGGGRYAGRARLTPAVNGEFILPVRMMVPDALPRYLYSVELGVWPSGPVDILSEDLARGWVMQTSGLEEIVPAQSGTVHSGSVACAVRTRKSFAGWMLSIKPAEPLDPFGFSLHLAIHPGDLVPGATDRFTVGVGKGSKPVDLLDGRLVDWSRREWQVIDIPVAEFGADVPISSVQFSGTLVGTLYLDDLALAAGQPPAPPVTAVLETRVAVLPGAFSLRQNYPNPFNSETVIAFDVPIGGDVELALYNLVGQQVANLARGHRPAGTYTLHWDGCDDAGRPLASGVYLYRLRIGEQVEARKLLLVR